jgi:hypothetical protein
MTIMAIVGNKKKWAAPAQSRPLGIGEPINSPFQVVTKSIGNYLDNIRKKMGDLATRPPIKRRTERCALLRWLNDYR